jgi:biopolymer transport protein ExbD
MITRPLDLQSRLRPPSKRLNPLPLFDVLLIAFFFSLLSSKFVLSSGLAINLPQGGSGPGLPASAVLTVRTDEMLLFEGQILSMSGLAPALATHVKQQRSGGADANLLIYLDRNVSVQTFFAVAEVAREQGVTRVQLAAEPRDGDTGLEGAFFR